MSFFGLLVGVGARVGGVALFSSLVRQHQRTAGDMRDPPEKASISPVYGSSCVLGLPATLILASSAGLRIGVHDSTGSMIPRGSRSQRDQAWLGRAPLPLSSDIPYRLSLPLVSFVCALARGGVSVAGSFLFCTATESGLRWRVQTELALDRLPVLNKHHFARCHSQHLRSHVYVPMYHEAKLF